jgi:hypothetical protein
MLTLDNDDDDDPNPMALLVFAIENVIDATVAGLAAQGLSAERDRIRDQLLHPNNRHWLLPKRDTDADPS